MSSLRRLLGAAFIAIATLAPSLALAERAKITLLLVCDTYELAAKNGRGGYPKIAGVVAAERAKGGNLLVAHSGDAFSPTLLSSFDSGEHVVELLNMIRPDVFVPGNHEYDFGPEIFRKRVAEATFPVLAANLRERSGEPVKNVADHRMMDLGGVKVGVVGLTAEDSPTKSKPGDLAFRGVVDTLRAQAAELRNQGADLIVAVAHADRRIDEQLMASRLADVILSGDDHDLWIQYDGRSVGVEAKQDGEYLVAVDLTVDIGRKDDGSRSVSWWPEFRVIDTASTEPEPAVAARVAAYEAELAKELDVALGRTETELDSRNATVRGGEAAIGNLFADALRTATGADAALINGGSFRAGRLYAAGSEITRRDVLREFPFGNKTVVLELTGRQLRQAVEIGLSNLREPAGRFPQVSGLQIVADRAAPAGKRIVSLRIGGAAVSDTRKYKVATNDYLQRGGDGYEMFKQARVLVDDRSAKLMVNDVMGYLRQKGTVAPRTEGRIVVR